METFRDEDLPKPGETWAYVGTGTNVTVKSVAKGKPFFEGEVEYLLEGQNIKAGIIGFLLHFTLVRERE